MHATERESAITEILKKRGFIAFRDLETLIDASPATLRRDLERMASEGRLARVHGGARLIESKTDEAQHLSGSPFHINVTVNRRQKEAIGRAAAGLCSPGEGVMINGGSTTLQMCDHLDGLNLQVLTNSLHIVSALAHQAGTRILVPGGALFKEQNIILSTRGEDNMPRFHAPKLFLGAASVGAGGVMEPDPVLVNSDRRFIERAEEIILLVDSSKFQGLSGHVVCDLDEIDVVVTDDGLDDKHARTLEAAGVRLIVA